MMSRAWLDEIVRVTDIPADKRADVDYLRAAVMLARICAKAALLPAAAPEQPDLFESAD